MKSIRRSIQRGFTLVELLIVVIILALLAAIVVPQFASSTDEAKEAALDSTLANMRAALDLYYQQHGEYPGANTAVPTGGCTGTLGAGTGGAGAQGATAFIDQMTMYTDGDGKACSKKEGAFIYGPYLKKDSLPPNPFTTNPAVASTLVVVVDGDLNLTGAASALGWKYDAIAGKFIADDASRQDR